METIFIIIYLLKKNCSENNLSKKVHNVFLFPIVKTLWPLEVLRNSALLDLLVNEIHLNLGVKTIHNDGFPYSLLCSLFNPFICHLIDLISSIDNSSNLCVCLSVFVCVCLCLCVCDRYFSTTTGPI